MNKLMESDPLNLVVSNLLPYSLFEYRAIKCSSLGCNSIIHRLQLLCLDSKHLDCCCIYLETVVDSDIIGTLRSDDGDGNEDVKKATVLTSKTTILHVHHVYLYISLPSLHDYDVIMPNFTFHIESTHATTKFLLCF